MNQVILIGNLTRDTELLSFSNAELCKFSIAVNRRYKNSDNESKDEVTYVDCQAWSSLGTTCNKYLSKGSQVLVVGHLRTESWETKDTHEKRSKLVVVCKDVQFLNKTGATGGQQDEGGSDEGGEETPF